MSRKFLTNLDLVKNELQNGVMHPLAAAPSSPAKFQIYGNTTDNTIYWWDGTVWQPAKSGAPSFGAVAPEQTFGSAPTDGIATTVSRSDHKHGNPVHDAAAHTSIPLNTFTGQVGAVNFNGATATNVATPTAPTDGVNKQYVDNLVTGLAWSDTVRAATTGNITLSGTQSIDGVAVVAGDRVLVKDQATASQNAVYVVSASGWVRALDSDSEAELVNMAVWVSEGTTLADTAWVMTTNAPIVVGTTNLTWVQFAGAGIISAGAGLTRTGNSLDVGAGTGITVAADQVALDTAFTDARYVDHTEIAGYVPTSRTITAGAGLTGGGDLAANRTVDVVAGDTSLTVSADNVVVNTGVIATVASVNLKADKATTMTAGAGLTGGGDLSSARTFDVGAGTGITVAADTVSFDTAYGDGRYALAASGVKRFAQDVGGATSQVITHNLATLDCIIQVYRKASPFDQIECDVEHTSTTTATLRFATAPAAAEYRVVALA